MQASQGPDQAANNGEFAGKAAVVSGGGRGIGLAIAIELVRAGAGVLLVGRGQEQLARAAADLTQRGPGKAAFLAADLADPEAPARMLDSCREVFGRMDYLVNNAALNPLGPIEDISVAQWDLVMNVNLRAVFLALQAALPIFRRQKKGAVLNLSSLASRTGGAAAGPHYAASKAGVNSLTRSFARAMAPFGVRVNCLCPGPIATPMVLEMPRAAQEKMMAGSPLGRLGTPWEAAASAMFLLSEKAGNITGATLDVNGGLWMH